MSARVLVIDDVADASSLQSKLATEYFDVVTAYSGADALIVCERAECDMVLLDVAMPDMDGVEICRRLKTNPSTQHIPVVMLTSLDRPIDRVRGLEAGADDFLVKPFADLILLSRVRSLSRLKLLFDEVCMRALTFKEIGIKSVELDTRAKAGREGHILIVDDLPSSYLQISTLLAAEHSVEIESRPDHALFRAAENSYDLLIVSLNLNNFDGLRLCSQLRSLERTRQISILAIADAGNGTQLARGLEIGVNDYLVRPVDTHELLARARAQVKRKRFVEWLKDGVRASMEIITADALTGLYNRSYMEKHLAALVEWAIARHKPIAMFMIDIDFFKSINDGHGREAGDEVLREFALRIRKSIRNTDLACRYDGEKFVIVMPDTDMAVATRMAERMRRSIAGEPFPIQQGMRLIDVTISIGIATLTTDNDSAIAMLKRAELALNRAKRDGRNRVVPEAA